MKIELTMETPPRPRSETRSVYRDLYDRVRLLKPGEWIKVECDNPKAALSVATSCRIHRSITNMLVLQRGKVLWITLKVIKEAV